MTAKDATDAFPGANQQTVFFDRQNKVLAAGWMKPTRASQQRAQHFLVAANEKNDQHRRKLENVSDQLHGRWSC
tara:strand:- start:85 stop:306 length:222 start_codon:yes stop_codon:yes gene_type:complete